MKNLKPLRDHIVVKLNARINGSSGGIFIPDAFSKNPTEGTVIAANEGYYDNKGKWVKLNVKVGDEVVILKDVGVEQIIDGHKCLIIKEDSLLGKV